MPVFREALKRVKRKAHITSQDQGLLETHDEDTKDQHASPGGTYDTLPQSEADARNQKRLDYFPHETAQHQLTELPANAAQGQVALLRKGTEEYGLIEAPSGKEEDRIDTGKTEEPLSSKPLPDSPVTSQFGESVDLGIQFPESPQSGKVLQKRRQSESQYREIESDKSLRAKLQNAESELHTKDLRIREIEQIHQKRIVELEKLYEDKMAVERARHSDLRESHRKELGKIDRHHKKALDDQSRYHERALNDQTRRHEQALNEQDRRHKQALDDQSRIDWEDHKAALHDKSKEFDRRILEAHEEVQNLTLDKQNLADDHEAEKGRFKTAIEKLKSDLEQRESDHHNEMVAWANGRVANAAARHDESIQMMNEEVKAMVAKHMQEVEGFQTQIRAAEATHAQEVAKLKEYLKEELDGHAEELAGLKKEQAEELETAVKETEKLAASHAKALELLEAKHAQEKQLLVQKQLQQTKGLRDSVRELNDALLTSDADVGDIFTAPDLPQSPDEQIRDQFSRIQQTVEELSRLGWRQDRAVWTDKMIKKAESHHGPRLLKQAIMQDKTWSLLFRLVFCSPFRMFGDEGRKLEQEWNEQCGKDAASNDKMYIWPAPGIKAERWRYMTMKECREVLSKPEPSQLDVRSRVVSGFQNSLRRLVSELKISLGEVVDVGSPQVQLIQRLSTEAFKLWLDFCMYRCRMRILLKGPIVKSTPEEIASSDSGAWTLTVTPEVGRHGNIKGLELETFTTVSGCTGESLAIP